MKAITLAYMYTANGVSVHICDDKFGGEGCH